MVGHAGSSESGLKWFQKMKEAIAPLSELPHRCPLAPENKEFPFEVRQLFYGRKPHQYRVLFTNNKACGRAEPNEPGSQTFNHCPSEFGHTGTDLRLAHFAETIYR
jgi:hypothetical protein